MRMDDMIDVDTRRMPKAEWRKRNEAAGIGTL
jgi:hypothetical protein